MAAGGVITLAWDNRHLIINPLTSRLRPKRSNSVSGDAPQAQQVQGDLGTIELGDLSSRSPSESNHKSHIGTPGGVGTASTPEVVHDTANSSSSGPAALPQSNVRQRSVHPQEDSSTIPEEIIEVTPLVTLGTKSAIAMTVTFVAIVVTFVVMKSTLTTLGRPFDASVPFSQCIFVLEITTLEIQFFVNMIIAGIIIFGGGPVVIPLLRGYTVDNGTSPLILLHVCGLLNDSGLHLRRMGKCIFPSRTDSFHGRYGYYFQVSSRDFLLGFAILQAFPGPNFNFAVYLGVLAVPSNPILGALLGFLGIFSPGIVLKLALLPLYRSWRSHSLSK